MKERQVFVSGDGVRLVADVGGPEDGPLVVLAHGGGQTRHSWSRAFDSLIDAGYRTINYDARGHGESGWSPDNRYPVERRWMDMETAIGSRRPVAVIGASMGGVTALYGMSLGFRPTALVLVDIAPNADRGGMQRVQDFMMSGLAGFNSLEEVQLAVETYNPVRRRSRDPSGLKRNLRLGTNGRWYWHWDPGMLEIDIDREQTIMRGTLDSLTSAPEVPVMLVRGRQSDVVTDETIAELRSLLPTLQVADISGAGHMVAGDRNDLFNSAILDFLTGNMPSL